MLDEYISNSEKAVDKALSLDSISLNKKRKQKTDANIQSSDDDEDEEVVESGSGDNDIFEGVHREHSNVKTRTIICPPFVCYRCKLSESQTSQESQMRTITALQESLMWLICDLPRQLISSGFQTRPPLAAIQYCLIMFGNNIDCSIVTVFPCDIQYMMMVVLIIVGNPKIFT